MYINILMTLIVNYIIVYGLYYICVCLYRVESDRISARSGRIGYPHVRVGSDMPKSISIQKKSDFIHIHYPVNRFFYCLTGSDRVGNPRIRTHLPSLPITYELFMTSNSVGTPSKRGSIILIYEKKKKKKKIAS